MLVHNTCQVSAKNVGKVSSNSVKKRATDAEFKSWLNKGKSNNVVYHGIEDGEKKYTGITMQELETRRKQHNRSGKNFSKLDPAHRNLTRNQARTLEQYYIELENGPNKLNKIYSISSNNKFYNQSQEWAKWYLGK